MFRTFPLLHIMGPFSRNIPREKLTVQGRNDFPRRLPDTVHAERPCALYVIMSLFDREISAVIRHSPGPVGPIPYPGPLPGDPVPMLLYLPEASLTGLLGEAGVVVGLLFGIP